MAERNYLRKTGKPGRPMIGKNYRIPITFTFDEVVFIKFREFCENNGYNKSRLLEKYIVQFLKKNGVK